MRARVAGLTTGQSVPTAGFLQIYPEGRYEDGQGNATPGRYDFVLDAATQTWRDMANPAADAYIVTAGPGEPIAIRAMFEERLTYSDGRTVRHTYWKWLRSSNLDATQFQYTGEQNVERYEQGREPLTMQAARELLLRGATQVEAVEQTIAAVEQQQAASLEASRLELADMREETAQSAALAVAAAGIKLWDAGDHLTLQNASVASDGYYRIATGAEAGQVWQKKGATTTRRPELESASVRGSWFTAPTEAGMQAYIASSLPQPPTGLNLTAQDTGRQFQVGAKLQNGQYVLTPLNTAEINAASFGVIDDVQMDDTGSMTAGSATLTLSTARFVQADVGKTIVVMQGAGMVDTQAGGTTLSGQQASKWTQGDVGKPIRIFKGYLVLLDTTITAVAADGLTCTLADPAPETWGKFADPAGKNYVSVPAFWAGAGVSGMPLGKAANTDVPAAKITAVSSDGKSATLSVAATGAVSNAHVEWGTDCTTGLRNWMTALGPGKPGVITQTGTGTVWTRLGLNLKDGTRIRVAQPLTLRVMPGAPERTDEKTQTALIAGELAYSKTGAGATAATRNIQIVGGSRLTLDINYRYAPYATLGGVRLFGLQDSRLEYIKVIGASSAAAGQPNFGFDVETNATGADTRRNVFIEPESELTPEWFLANGTSNQVSLIGFVLSSATSGFAGRNGAHYSKTREQGPSNWEWKYTPSRTYENTIVRPYFVGGSHGLSFTNVRNNIVRDVKTLNCSHRGVIITPTCDDNYFYGGVITDSGATGVHIAYDSRRNKFYNIVVDGVRETQEGDGFKAYVLCDSNEFIDCLAINVSKSAFRWAHGSNYNKRVRCRAIWTKAKPAAPPEGQPKSVERLAWEETKGFALYGASDAQWNFREPNDAYMLREPVHRQCIGNHDVDCTAEGTYYGFYEGSYITTLAGAVTLNLRQNCRALATGYGFYTDPKAAPASSGNVAMNCDASTATTPYNPDWVTAQSRLYNAMDLADKPTPISGSRQPEWDNYVAWTDNPALVTTTYKPGSGNLMLAYTRAVKGVAVGGSLSAVYNVTTAASGDLTTSRIVVYRVSDGAQVAQSADLVGNWGSVGGKKSALTVSQAITAGDALYIGILTIGTTPPTLSAPSGSLVINANAGSAPLKRAALTGQTAVPGSIGAPLETATGTNQTPWFALA